MKLPTHHMLHQKLRLHYCWWQILVRQTFDETVTLPIKFSCHTAFCDVQGSILWHATQHSTTCHAAFCGVPRSILWRATQHSVTYHTAFCHMLWHAEAMPKLHHTDVYTIYSICHVTKPNCVAFCHAAQNGRTLTWDLDPFGGSGWFWSLYTPLHVNFRISTVCLWLSFVVNNIFMLTGHGT